MPFYRAKLPRDTKKGTRARADILGIPENTPMSATQQIQWSPQEIEKMRQTVLDHDRQQAQNNVFDPNKPTKVVYKHQEFPKMVYLHEKSRPSFDKKVVRGGAEEVVHVPAHFESKVVKDEKELKQALKDGWSEEAPDLAAKHRGLDPEEPPEVVEPEQEDEEEGEQK